MNLAGAGRKGFSAARASTTRKSTETNVRRSFEGTLGGIPRSRRVARPEYAPSDSFIPKYGGRCRGRQLCQPSRSQKLVVRYFHGGQRSTENKSPRMSHHTGSLGNTMFTQDRLPTETTISRLGVLGGSYCSSSFRGCIIIWQTKTMRNCLFSVSPG